MPQDKPKIAVNLDTLQREGVVPEPFTAIVGGKPYTLTDPVEFEWDVLMAVAGSPASFVRAAVPTDKAEEFSKAIGHLPTWKVNALADSYQKHFGLPSPPESHASQD